MYDLSLVGCEKRIVENLASRPAMSKSGFLGGFWRSDLRYLELISWDETWYTSSSGQNLDPIFFL